MPASSTSRRSVISPQRPRTSGRRNAFTRFRVSRVRDCWLFCIASSCDLIPPYASLRDFSSAAICACDCCSASLMGFTRFSTACSRSPSSRFARSCWTPRFCSARRKKFSLFDLSDLLASSEKAVASLLVAASNAESRSACRAP